MKRILTTLLVLALLLGCACAEGQMIPPPDRASWPGESQGVMYVVNCEEWVSLRESPSTSAPALRKIYLGSWVDNCREFSDEFTYCEYDDGEEVWKGYILSEYLSAPGFFMRTAQEGTQGTAIPDKIGDFSGSAYWASWTVDDPRGNYRVYCARGIAAYEGGEGLYLGCFDGKGDFVWGLYTGSSSAGELDGTDAYLGGTAEEPLVLVNSSSLGLAAIDFATGDVRWTVDRAEAYLGGSQSHALANDGTLFVGGYYGPSPVAISKDGEVLWKSEESPNAVWLCGIRIEGSEIVGDYESPDTEDLERVWYDRKTGEVVRTR